MAERQRQQRQDDDRNADGATRSMASVVSRARRDFEELLGHPVERVAAATPDSDGWRLDVDVVELARIPDSTSVLGTYEVSVDRDGEILGYERTRRFYRNRTDEEAM